MERSTLGKKNGPPISENRKGPIAASQAFSASETGLASRLQAPRIFHEDTSRADTSPTAGKVCIQCRRIACTRKRLPRTMTIFCNPGIGNAGYWLGSFMTCTCVTTVSLCAEPFSAPGKSNAGFSAAHRPAQWAGLPELHAAPHTGCYASHTILWTLTDAANGSPLCLTVIFPATATLPARSPRSDGPSIRPPVHRAHATQGRAARTARLQKAAGPGQSARGQVRRWKTAFARIRPGR